MSVQGAPSEHSMAATFTCRGDRSSVEHLQNVVNSLLSDKSGSYVSWPEEGRSEPDLRTMEETLHLLKNLVSAYDSRISSVRKRLGVPRLTLENLPDETIARAFEHTDYGFHSLVRFSQISSRIRRVILHTPLLWAKIPLDTRLRAGAIEHIARCSGTLGLTAIVHHTQDPSSLIDRFLNATLNQILNFAPLGEIESASLDEIFRHSHRWTHAEFVTFNQWANQIEQHFRHPDLSSLRTLVINCTELEQRAFIHHWAMPRLYDLHCIHDVPDPLNAEMLTECTFEVYAFQVSEMLVFLASTPCLKSLKVVVVDLTDSHSDSEEGDCNASLPLLEYLQYTSGYSDENAAQHLGCIACPNLKHLSYINTDEYEYHPNHDRFSSLRHVRTHYPLLNTFEFAFSMPHTYLSRIETVVFFEDILCSLPVTIQKVRLSGWFMGTRTSSMLEGETAPPPQAVYPNLKELDIENCNSISEDDFYTNLADCLGRLGVTLQSFRPTVHLLKKGETEDVVGDALATLRHAGVLEESADQA